MGAGNITIPLGYHHWAQRASNNPVAQATAYQQLISNVLNILLGAPPDTQSLAGFGKKSVCTAYYKLADKAKYLGNKFRSKGIIGHLLAYFGVHETQYRGTLHFHLIAYGGITPELLEAIAGIHSLSAEVSKVLDTMYKAELSPSFHMVRLLKNYKRTDKELKKLLEKNVPKNH